MMTTTESNTMPLYATAKCTLFKNSVGFSNSENILPRVTTAADLKTPSKKRCSTTKPPPLSVKRTVHRAMGDVAFFPSFPSLADNQVDKLLQDEILQTPKQTFHSPLSVEHFAMPRLKLKPRISSSRRANENQDLDLGYSSSSDDESLDLPQIPFLPSLESCTSSPTIQLRFRPSSNGRFLAPLLLPSGHQAHAA